MLLTYGETPSVTDEHAPLPEGEVCPVFVLPCPALPCALWDVFVVMAGIQNVLRIHFFPRKWALDNDSKHGCGIIPYFKGSAGVHHPASADVCVINTEP